MDKNIERAFIRWKPLVADLINHLKRSKYISIRKLAINHSENYDAFRNHLIRYHAEKIAKLKKIKQVAADKRHSRAKTDKRKRLEKRKAKQQERWRKTLADIDSDVGWSKAARNNGFDVSSISKYLARNGLLKQYAQKKKSIIYNDDIKLKAKELKGKGLTIRAIAKELSVSKSIVHHWVKNS